VRRQSNGYPRTALDLLTKLQFDNFTNALLNFITCWLRDITVHYLKPGEFFGAVRLGMKDQPGVAACCDSLRCRAMEAHLSNYETIEGIALEFFSHIRHRVSKACMNKHRTACEMRCTAMLPKPPRAHLGLGPAPWAPVQCVPGPGTDPDPGHTWDQGCIVNLKLRVISQSEGSLLPLPNLRPLPLAQPPQMTQMTVTRRTSATSASTLACFLLWFTKCA
jgi:hypothetical protein